MRIEAGTQTRMPEVTANRQKTEQIAPKTQDKVELSLSKLQMDAGPEVRTDRIEAVRSRIASGFYDRADVREGIAEAFLKTQIA